jgi:hypothetical protein
MFPYPYLYLLNNLLNGSLWVIETTALPQSLRSNSVFIPFVPRTD